MALAKDHRQPSSRSFYGNMLETGSSVHFPHISSYGFDEYDQQDGDNGSLESPNSQKNMNNNNQVITHSPPLSSSSSANSSNNNGFSTIHASNYQTHEEVHSLFNFKTGFSSFIHSAGSLLSFQNDQDHHHEIETNYHKLSHPNDQNYPIWEGDQHSPLKEMKNCSSNLQLLDEVNRLSSASGDYQDSANEWLYGEADVSDPPQESATQQTSFNKRPNMDEENMQPTKKQCTTSSKKPAKPKTYSSKDPQSIAAKNRRERISERLKILQDLVPNGTKVDLVTMLEKAIGYVKFLQLQVKVLATDEFWPAAGGKAPDISQVRETIDAILSTQRSSEGTTTTTTTTSSSSK